MNKIVVLIFVLLSALTVCGFPAGANTAVEKNSLQDTCTNISTLPCSSINVTLPFNLNFNAAIANTITDKNGLGIGFTTVNSYSGTRTSQDGQPSNNVVKGYEPSKINLTGGKLQLTANKGIDYLTNNNQLNVLGVQITAANKLQLEVKIINPFDGTLAQQAGLWYGLNDKTFIKLSINGNKVELRKEFNDVSSTITGNTNPDQRITALISGLNTKTVTLRMVVDTEDDTVEGFYSTDGVNFINTGAKYPVAALNLAGMGITAGNVYAGIYSTYRNGTTAVTYTFDDFGISTSALPLFNGCPLLSTLPCLAVKVQTPFNLAFDEPAANSITDKNNNGTGFTTVNNYSGTRLAADGPPPVAEVPGYEPSKINLTGGQLQLTANKGIDYQTNNNQLNVLGVQVNAANKTQLDVKLVNPYYGIQSQQAGLWYGLNDKTFIKLGITGNKIELRKELNDVSNGVTGSANADQRITTSIAGLNSKTVSLRLLIDSAAQTAEGFYSTNGVNYTQVGITGYPQPFLNIAGMNVNTGQVFTGIYCTYRNGTSAVTYTFDDFGVLQPQPVSTEKKLSFSTDTLNFTVVKNGPVISQSVNVASNPFTTGISLSKTNADWLTLPATFSGVLQLGAQNINSAINAGSYQALIIVAAADYEPDTLLVNLTVVDGVQQQAININFQDEQTVPPTGYLVDYGQAYGERSGPHQGALLTYGWKKRTDGTLLSLIGNGRNRNTPEDVILATILHMQANDITTGFQGVKTEGYWELKVPNGVYDVTATVGDGQVNAAPESHSLNIEGVSAIANFIPNGKKGDIGRFKSKTVRVNVSDENLTINADGGTNTKIANADVVPVSLNPYLYWAADTKNIIAKKGSVKGNSFTATIGSSNNLASSYSITTQYTGAVTGWLSYNSSISGSQPNITFNYQLAQSLPVGIYYATVKAVTPQFTSANFKVQLNIVDTLRPYVISSTPANGAQKIDVSTVSIAANSLHVPVVSGYPGGVDNSTITDTTVKLFKITNMVATAIAGTVQGTGGGDAISFSPVTALEPNTTYKFVITDDVKSKAGIAFIPYESTFTTADVSIDTTNRLNAQFEKIAIPGTQNVKYSSLKIGPDGKFYALRLNGAIDQFDIDHSSGMLLNKRTINTLVNKYGQRTAIGLTFDPASSPTAPILWVSHSSSGLVAAPAFDGNISRLYGDSLQLEDLVITKLPRSTRDHMTNSMAFGPDGALYICQGSNSSAGEYDADWQRKESLLSGTVLRLDISKLNGLTLPLNVQTTSNQNVINNAPAVSATMSDGTYNPYGTQSPLTIYASGVRNAYDLVWHSNGQLYLPANGSGGGGNSPASVNGTRRPNGAFYNGPIIASTTGVQVQDDWLFRVNPEKPVGYYGHPNPLRGEYVINRGYADNALYSPAVVADANYRQGYNFGLNHSPDGVIEYKSNAFNGALKNKLLVCRFSGGGDIIVMEPGSMLKIDTLGDDDQIYNIVKVTTGSGYNGLVGMSGFANPLDIVEDVSNGNLYIAEFNWNDNPNLTAQITLLRVQSAAVPPPALLAVTAEPQTPVDSNYKVYSISLANKGDGVLKIKSIALAGNGAQQFSMKDVLLPSDKNPLTLQKNSVVNFNLLAKKSSRHVVAKLVVTDVKNISKEVDVDNLFQIDSGKRSTGLTDTVKNKNVSDLRQLLVYPNPNKGNIIYTQLNNFSGKEAVNLALYDMMGKIVKQQNIITDSSGHFATQFTINNTGENRLYIVRATYTSGSKFGKVITY